MKASPQRVDEIEVLFRECREDWRTLLERLERGPESYLAETPWLGVDELYQRCSEEEQSALRETLREMLESDESEEQVSALGLLGSVSLPFDFDEVLVSADRFQSDLSVQLEWLLVVGQRQLVAVRDAVEAALENRSCRHAAAISLAQLDPDAAGPVGREMYAADRDEIVASLHRPLAEHDYATFFQMTEAVFELHGKDGVNRFLRSVADGDKERLHEMAQVVQRILRQRPAGE